MLCFVALCTLKDSSQWSVFEHHNVLNEYKYCEQTRFEFSFLLFNTLFYYIFPYSVTQTSSINHTKLCCRWEYTESYIIILNVLLFGVMEMVTLPMTMARTRDHTHTHRLQSLTLNAHLLALFTSSKAVDSVIISSLITPSFSQTSDSVLDDVLLSTSWNSHLANFALLSPI